jgi:methyltransferase family protein
VVRPVYRTLFPPPVPITPDTILASIDTSGRPVRPMLRSEFDEMAAGNPYYKGRWRYTSVVLAEAAKLIVRDDLRTALEVGAPVKPVLTGAHVMDYRFREELDSSVEVTVHDATDVPWPFEDKQFGLFIALQVWEHLGSGQRDAFREVRRVARHAILSLPIDWDMDDPSDIHHGISEEQVLSWFAPIEPTLILEGNPGPRRRRLVFVFEDLPA